MSSNVYLPFKIKADFKCLKWKFECSTVKSIVNIYDLSAVKLEGRGIEKEFFQCLCGM